MMTVCVSQNMQQYMLGSRIEVTSLISGSGLGYSGSRVIGCLPHLSTWSVTEEKDLHIHVANL
jgi:hypothetical protein